MAEQNTYLVVRYWPLVARKQVHDDPHIARIRDCAGSAGDPVAGIVGKAARQKAETRPEMGKGADHEAVAGGVGPRAEHEPVGSRGSAARTRAEADRPSRRRASEGVLQDDAAVSRQGAVIILQQILSWTLRSAEYHSNWLRYGTSNPQALQTSQPIPAERKIPSVQSGSPEPVRAPFSKQLSEHGPLLSWITTYHFSCVRREIIEIEKSRN